MTFSRRHFLACTAGAAACACAGPTLAATWPAKMTAPALPPRLNPAPRHNVTIDPGPLRVQFDHQRDLYMGLDDDRLLKPFRSRAKQPAPGEDMGGWYDDATDFHVDPADWSTANWHGYIPGHSFGQYVSGLARGYAMTGDETVRTKIATLISSYAETISPTFWDGYTIPAYTFDKTAIGLIDAYQYAGVAEAIPALDKLTDSVLPYLPEKALTPEESRARPHTMIAQTWDETYTLPENLFLAWRLGMGERYAALAMRYLQDDTMFDPLARNESPYKGWHAYSHVNALNSAVQAYYSTGQTKYLDAAKNGFAFVQAQSYATGGWGPQEGLLAPDDRDTLYKSLTSTHASFETPCGAYGHFKITRYLLSITGDTRYGDSMERVLYNTILGARPTEPDGRTFYYADYNNDASKGFHHDKWPCCSGTFIQLTADYAMSAWLSDAKGIYANLYIPSTFSGDVSGQAVTIRQTTDYPFDDTTRFAVSLKKPATFAFSLRIPAWAGPKTRVLVNGKPYSVKLAPGTFAAIERKWHDGDSVTLTLDMTTRLEPLDDAHPNVVALLNGPLVLFPINGSSTPTRAELLAVTRQDPHTWTSGDAVFKPFAAIGDEHYRLYTELTA